MQGIAVECETKRVTGTTGMLITIQDDIHTNIRFSTASGQFFLCVDGHHKFGKIDVKYRITVMKVQVRDTEGRRQRELT